MHLCPFDHRLSNSYRCVDGHTTNRSWTRVHTVMGCHSAILYCMSMGVRGLCLVALSAALITLTTVPSAVGRIPAKHSAHRPAKRHPAKRPAKRHPAHRPAKRHPAKRPTKRHPAQPPACASSYVLLLGSYPAELSANLSRETLDPGQPPTAWGHAPNRGRLEVRRLRLGVAGQAPDVTYAA